jgi:hypothetical protein
MSENSIDATAALQCASSIERARYWFEQYRCASGWEARLIRAIREETAERSADRRLPAKGSV